MCYYVSRKEYAERWSISVGTVDRMIKAGRLKAYKIGRCVRIDANAFIEGTTDVNPLPVLDVKKRLRSVLE